MGKAKGAAKQAAADASPAHAAVLVAYAALPDTLAALAPFALYKSMGVQLHFGAGDTLSAEQLAFVMATLKCNMEPVFGAKEWPAQERSRRKDAVSAEARYAFAAAVSAEGDASAASSDAPSAPPSPLGFLHYRFVVEEGVAVLYVYELQVTEAARGKGLGKFLMLFAEMLAKRSPGPLAGVMLTIQRANTRALRFYTEKCKYAMDGISPAKTDPFAEPDEYDYEIFSKIWVEEGRRTLQRSAEQARLQNAMHAG